MQFQRIVLAIEGPVMPAVRMKRRGRLRGMDKRRQDYMLWRNAYRDRIALAWGSRPMLEWKWVRADIQFWRQHESGDWDNLAKAICDALTGVVWGDDACVKCGFVEIIHKCGPPDLTLVELESYHLPLRLENLMGGRNRYIAQLGPIGAKILSG